MFEKCGCCLGTGQVYMYRPTTGPSQIEYCSNCDGTGMVWNFGTFSITFKRNDELPKVKYKHVN